MAHCSFSGLHCHFILAVGAAVLSRSEYAFHLAAFHLCSLLSVMWPLPGPSVRPFFSKREKARAFRTILTSFYVARRSTPKNMLGCSQPLCQKEVTRGLSSFCPRSASSLFFPCFVCRLPSSRVEWREAPFLISHRLLHCPPVPSSDLSAIQVEGNLAPVLPPYYVHHE